MRDCPADGKPEYGLPQDSPHAFGGFSFRDPEGNVWDVAWAEGTVVSPDGDLTWR